MKLSFFFMAAFAAAGFYANDPNIYELSAANFDKVVQNSNYTSVVEFYAPWCGHCRQLEPVWRKMGRYMLGARYAINVAAVNCDEKKNKPLCARYKVNSYPQIMVFRPPKHQRGETTLSKHVGEPYHGQRELVPITEFVKSRVKNYVSRYSGPNKSFGKWLQNEPQYPKIVLVSSALTNSPLIKSLAIDFLDTVDVAHVTLKTPQSDLKVPVGDEEISFPVTEEDALPILLAWDAEKKEFVRYEGKLTRMGKIEKWVIDTTGAIPREGVYSKREKKMRKHRGKPKEKVVKDEL